MPSRFQAAILVEMDRRLLLPCTLLLMVGESDAMGLKLQLRLPAINSVVVLLPSASNDDVRAVRYNYRWLRPKVFDIVASRGELVQRLDAGVYDVVLAEPAVAATLRGRIDAVVLPFDVERSGEIHEAIWRLQQERGEVDSTEHSLTFFGDLVAAWKRKWLPPN